MTESESNIFWVRRLLLVLLLGGLLILSFLVLQPFMVSIAWASILTYVAWPLNKWLRRVLRERRVWAALGATLLVTAVLGIPFVWLITLLQQELVLAFGEVVSLVQNGITVPASIAKLPRIGGWLQEKLPQLLGDSDVIQQQLTRAADRWGGSLAKVIGGAGLNAVMMGIALVTAFFLFRDGERMLQQLRHLLESILGPRVSSYFHAVGYTTKAVVYGLFVAAVVQGALAGASYWVAGVRAPVFWGAMTAILALIPFGAPLVWGAIGLWLLMAGDTVAGVGVLLWGALVVSWIDNLVRPLVISGSTNIPFLLVIFGVFGGLGAFGLIGLFVGPVILAVLLAVWREWQEGYDQRQGQQT